MNHLDQLLTRLREWRAERAAKDGVAHFRVFSNATLAEITKTQPKTMEEMLCIPGIKERKFDKYGAEILKIVSATADPEGKNVFTVSSYLDALNHGLQKFDARIQGEVSSVDFRDTYLFFSIKDKRDNAILNCFMWKEDYDLCGVELAPGLEVIIYGYPEVYKPSGRLSFRTETVELVGEGMLKKAYDELKRKLELEGLFAPERKRPVPNFPQRIGLLTSRMGAVIDDFLHNLGKFGFQIRFFDVRVEGQRAVKDIVKAIQYFQDHSDEIDILVIIRGGGSLESLLAFNNEAIVRAVTGFPKPVICGIGHDRDVSLVSLVADLAVSTPTAVTRVLNQTWEHALAKIQLAEREIISRFQTSLIQTQHGIREHAANLKDRFGSIFERFRAVERAVHQRFSQLGRYLRATGQQLDRYEAGMLRGMIGLIRQAGERIKFTHAAIAARDPMNQLKLGYSLVTAGGRLIRSVRGLSPGAAIDIRVADGVLASQVNKIIPKNT